MIFSIGTSDGIKYIDTDCYESWYDTYITLEMIKEWKIEAINIKTDVIIDNGFTYATKVFGFTEADQINYIGMIVLKDFLTYPMKVKCKAECEYYDIADANEVEIFGQTACGWKQSVYNSGWTLKDSVKVCSTIEQVCNIVDSR